jgi:hypothetical protein
LFLNSHSSAALLHFRQRSIAQFICTAAITNEHAEKGKEISRDFFPRFVFAFVGYCFFWSLPPSCTDTERKKSVRGEDKQNKKK